MLPLRHLTIGVGVLMAVVMVSGVGLYRFAEPKLNLFSPERVSDNFAHMDDVFPVNRVAASPQAQALDAHVHALPEMVEVGGAQRNLSDLLSLTKTNVMIVVRDGVVVGEYYGEGYDQTSKMTSFSVAKSVVSMMMGHVLLSGGVRSLDDQVTDYVPEMIGTSWEGVRLIDLMQMRSGVAFSEDYGDARADVMSVHSDFYLQLWKVDERALAYGRAFEPGTAFHYASIDTHMLSWVLRKVSGERLVDLLEDSLWYPLGMEMDASWITDMHGTEVGFWGFNANPRDLAKLGMLMLARGEWEDQALLDPAYVDAILNPVSFDPQLAPGAINGVWGYEHQWWRAVPADRGDFSAIGIWGQFIYVDPRHNVVIVKGSSDPDFSRNEYPTIQVFRQLSEWASTL